MYIPLLTFEIEATEGRNLIRIIHLLINSSFRNATIPCLNYNMYQYTQNVALFNACKRFVC